MSSSKCKVYSRIEREWVELYMRSTDKCLRCVFSVMFIVNEKLSDSYICSLSGKC